MMHRLGHSVFLAGGLEETIGLIFWDTSFFFPLLLGCLFAKDYSSILYDTIRQQQPSFIATIFLNIEHCMIMCLK